jgi:lysyl-tRNA synthetase class 2
MSQQYTVLEQNRLDKLERLRGMGIEPYPSRAERTHSSLEAIRQFEAAEGAIQVGETAETVTVTLAGRLRAMRPMGKITFAHIEDGDGRIQLFLRLNDLGEQLLELFNRELDLGLYRPAR